MRIVQASTTILGAGKITGKTSNGWSIGVLEAVTAPEFARLQDAGVQSRSEVEPLTNYFVGRLLRETARGGVGVLGTSVVRRLGNDGLQDELARSALLVGGDAYYFFDDQREWLVSGLLSGSRVQGSQAAIDELQQSSVHYFQRPDRSTVRLDSTRTSLSGLYGDVSFGRQSGNWRVNTSVSTLSPGFESNDVGYQMLDNRVNVTGSVSWLKFQPDRWTRQRNVDLSAMYNYDYDGLCQGGYWTLNASAQLLNYWRVGANIRRGVRAFDDLLTRGGPQGVELPSWAWSAWMGTDSRKAISFHANGSYSTSQSGGWSGSGGLMADFKISDRLTVSTGPEVLHAGSTGQYVDTVENDPTARFGNRYIFADLDQRQFSLTTRLNLLLTPTISLQTYLQPLLAVGRYWGIKEFTRPRAFEFARYGEDIGTITRDLANAEYSIDPDGDGPAALFSVDDPDYNLKSLRLQTVFRWEFRPGSTLYVVWTEGRRDEELPGQFDFGRDARRLFNSPSDDVFAVKVAYWFGR